MSLDPKDLVRHYKKPLSPVEVNHFHSNQHEFNGDTGLQNLLGLNRRSMTAKFSVFGTTIHDIASVTWYDARENTPDRTEYRLYYQDNIVMSHAQNGDSAIFGFDSLGNFHIIIMKS